MVQSSRVTILIKAYPQPSKKHIETVCCAGLDAEGNWRRLYPVRFRQLADEQCFSRWNIVKFSYSRPLQDSRKESCRIHEETIQILGKVSSKQEKRHIVDSAVVLSELEAGRRGDSLALIRPSNVRFSSKPRSLAELADAREAFEEQAKQASMFDRKLDLLEPCPYEFKMKYVDGSGQHSKTCSDWETSAAFFRLSKKYTTAEVLQHLEHRYCVDYVKTGLIFALGNLMKRPRTWQLLGIFPSEKSDQLSMEV